MVRCWHTCRAWLPPSFRVGRHHHRGPLCEGRGLTHALTDTAPTDLTVAAALVRKACSKRRRSRLWSKPGESEDVGTRVRLHCDGTGLCCCCCCLYRNASMRRTAYRLNQRTNPGNLSSLAGTTDGSLAHAKYEVGIREQSPDSRSSLAILRYVRPRGC